MVRPALRGLPFGGFFLLLGGRMFAFRESMFEIGSRYEFFSNLLCVENMEPKLCNSHKKVEILLLI